MAAEKTVWRQRNDPAFLERERIRSKQSKERPVIKEKITQQVIKKNKGSIK